MINLSVFLPIYNESENIQTVVAETVDFLTQNTNEYELILVNDGSTDATLSILHKLSEPNKNIRVIDHVVNKGYGAAISTGIDAAVYEWVFFMDSDGQFHIHDLKSFFPHTTSADFVIGYRTNRQDPPIRVFLANLYKSVVKMLFKLRVTDIDCAFKLMHKEKVKALDITSDTFFVSTELLCKAQKNDYVIKELPVKHLPRSKGNSSVTLKRSLHSIIDLSKLYWQIVVGK